jgi:hypothetical protein
MASWKRFRTPSRETFESEVFGMDRKKNKHPPDHEDPAGAGFRITPLSSHASLCRAAMRRSRCGTGTTSNAYPAGEFRGQRGTHK